MFEVKLRSGHPTGSYRRGGKLFQRGVVVRMDRVPKAIADDKWLMVSEIVEKQEKQVDVAQTPAIEDDKAAKRGRRSPAE